MSETEQLRLQVQSLEDFANVVVDQRNQALNEIATLKAQLIRIGKDKQNES